ncbi:hypothetical protein Droror1_Dr00007366 [Drosera rotundifolia]
MHQTSFGRPLPFCNGILMPTILRNLHSPWKLDSSKQPTPLTRFAGDRASSTGASRIPVYTYFAAVSAAAWW